jgi:hypothetical protein
MGSRIKGNGIHVALATCHDKRNFDSMLQSHATQTYLESQGLDVHTTNKISLGKAIESGCIDYCLCHDLDMKNLPIRRTQRLNLRIRNCLDTTHSNLAIDEYR